MDVVLGLMAGFIELLQHLIPIKSNAVAIFDTLQFITARTESSGTGSNGGRSSSGIP
jgi:hypothetical protein